MKRKQRDQRRGKRYADDQIIHIEFRGDRFLIAENINISSSGLLFRSSQTFQEEESLDLLLSIGRGEMDLFNSQARAKVVRKNVDENGSYLIAAEFTDIDTKLQQKLLEGKI